MRGLGRLGVVAAAMWLAAAPAQAQAGFGDGIRVGGTEGRLHPFVELELRYDSNVATFFAPDTKASDLILHVRPGLQLSVPGENVAVELLARLDWAQYFGIDESVTKDLSFLYANVSLGVGFNRKGQVGLELDEQFVRSNQPTVYSIASGIVSNWNEFTAAVPWRPGGGALVLTATADWTLESFDSYKSGLVCNPSLNPYCDPGYLSDLGYNNIGIKLGANWKFLPKTAALLDLSWFDRLPNSTRYSIGATGMRAQAGVTGLVTPHLAATLKAGYGTTLGLTLDPAAGPTPSDFGTWLALASLEWIPSTFTSVKLTFNHDLGLDPGSIWALYGVTHLTLEGKSKLNSKLGVSLTGDWAMLAYRDAASTSSQVFTIRPAVQADLSDWLMLELAYQYTDRSTDLPVAAAPPGWKYTKQEVWLRAVVTY
jgi:opacity protein-like surface antigen